MLSALGVLSSLNWQAGQASVFMSQEPSLPMKNSLLTLGAVILRGTPIVTQVPSCPWELTYTLLLASLCYLSLSLASWDYLPDKLPVPISKQNLPSQTVFLCHEDYFIFKKQRTQEEPLTLPLIA